LPILGLLLCSRRPAFRNRLSFGNRFPDGFNPPNMPSVADVEGLTGVVRGQVLLPSPEPKPGGLTEPARTGLRSWSTEPATRAGRRRRAAGGGQRDEEKVGHGQGWYWRIIQDANSNEDLLPSWLRAGWAPDFAPSLDKHRWRG
jgi:hypothetical protein